MVRHWGKLAALLMILALLLCGAAAAEMDMPVLELRSLEQVQYGEEVKIEYSFIGGDETLSCKLKYNFSVGNIQLTDSSTMQGRTGVITLKSDIFDYIGVNDELIFSYFWFFENEDGFSDVDGNHARIEVVGAPDEFTVEVDMPEKIELGKQMEIGYSISGGQAPYYLTYAFHYSGVYPATEGVLENAAAVGTLSDMVGHVHSVSVNITVYDAQDRVASAWVDWTDVTDSPDYPSDLSLEATYQTPDGSAWQFSEYTATIEHTDPVMIDYTINSPYPVKEAYYTVSWTTNYRGEDSYGVVQGERIPINHDSGSFTVTEKQGDGLYITLTVVDVNGAVDSCTQRFVHHHSMGTEYLPISAKVEYDTYCQLGETISMSYTGVGGNGEYRAELMYGNDLGIQRTVYFSDSTVSFTPPLAGQYWFKLTVYDSLGHSITLDDRLFTVVDQAGNDTSAAPEDGVPTVTFDNYPRSITVPELNASGLPMSYSVTGGSGTYTEIIVRTYTDLIGISLGELRPGEFTAAGSSGELYGAIEGFWPTNYRQHDADGLLTSYNHFVNHGMAEGRQGCEAFNVSIYRANYPDLKAAFGDNLTLYYQHYQNSGKAEGRVADKLLGVETPDKPSAPNKSAYAAVYDFDYYTGKYPDIANAFGGDRAATLDHFIHHGMAEGRRGNADFCVEYYRTNYADIAGAFGDDLKAYYTHYMNHGLNEGRIAYKVVNDQPAEPDVDPNAPDSREGYYAPVYDFDYYISRYQDIAAAFGGNRTATLEHFINNGMAEGRQGSAEFNVDAYRANYADLAAAFGSQLDDYYKHYINHGKAEGRSGK